MLRILLSRIASRASRASPSLSSTRRMSIGLPLVTRSIDVSPFLADRRGSGFQREEERRPLAGRGLHPDPSAVALDDALAQREADAGARILLRPVQPLEDDEQALKCLGSMPMPLSFTEKIHSAPSLRAEMWTRGRVTSLRNLMALPTRFWKTCTSCVRSASTVGRSSW